MKIPGAGRLHYLEGEVSNWHLAGGYVYLKIGDYPVCLRESRLTSKFKNRNEVRVLLREPPGGDGVSTILAWQRRGQERVHYQGMRVSIPLVLVATAVGVLGWLAHTALGLAGAALLLFEGLLALRMWWVLRRFDSAAEWPVDDAIAAAAERVANSVSVPIDLPVPPVGSNVQTARASSWPAEILEFTHDAIIIWEMDGAGILYWNRAAERLYGFTREQAYGRVTHELLKTKLAGGVGELETRLARYGVWVGQLCHTCADGRRVEVEGQLSLMSQEHRPWLVLEVNRDVTDRNRAEAERREIEQQLKRLYSTSNN